MDDSLSTELCNKVLEDLDTQMYTLQGETPTQTGTVLLWARRSIFVQKFTKRVGAASIQYWRWRGQASKDVPVALTGRAPTAWTQRLPILLLSLPVPSSEVAVWYLLWAALSAGTSAGSSDASLRPCEDCRGVEQTQGSHLRLKSLR